jgi:hypothetical protein
MGIALPDPGHAVVNLIEIAAFPWFSRAQRLD